MKAKIEGGEVKRTATSTKSSGEVVDLLAASSSSRPPDHPRGTDQGEDAAERRHPGGGRPEEGQEEAGRRPMRGVHERR